MTAQVAAVLILVLYIAYRFNIFGVAMKTLQFCLLLSKMYKILREGNFFKLPKRKIALFLFAAAQFAVLSYKTITLCRD